MNVLQRFQKWRRNRLLKKREEMMERLVAASYSAEEHGEQGEGFYTSLEGKFEAKIKRIDARLGQLQQA